MRSALDKAILTLASGAFGLSLTFSEHLGGKNPVHRWPLLAAWTCLTVSIVVTLSSFAASERGLHLAASRLAPDKPNLFKHARDPMTTKCVRPGPSGR
jgi:hypothetical protein